MSISSKLAGLLRRLREVPPQPPAPSAVSAEQVALPERWEDQFSAPGLTAAGWIEQRRAGGRLYSDLSPAAIDRLRVRFPNQSARTRRAADRVCRHEFDLLGSGPYTPVDPDRPRAADGYTPIDWALDPIAGKRFPTGFPFSDWNPQMRPGLADIKLPWEIGRCQHWPTLGQAFRLTGDERYAAELLRQHADFLEMNPVGDGVQYVCTMDIAIRAFNWAIAFELIRTARVFDATAAVFAYRSMFEVGLFIESHLENKYEVTSNHFLSNAVGLYALGVVFADLPVGQRWLREGRQWLEQEMKVQVLEDGADYESSIPYHRLVAELFLSGARLAECEGAPLSAFYLDRLRRMIDFLAGVLRPDGLLPQVGDADDGRVHIFTDYGTWPPQDGRHLIGPAAMLLREPSWLGTGDEDSLWEAAWWGYADEPAPSAVTDTRGARLFEHAGIAIARSSRAYLLVSNGRVGTNGFGNHKHNDLLAFEFHGDGVPLLVDPGSYVYTSDPDARNLFRGTSFHNTVIVDDVEQNDIRADYLFRMFETSTVEHRVFEDAPAFTDYRGRHTGYERLPAPVTHDRAFRVLKDEGALCIVDRFTGSGRHALRWHFHFAPGVVIEQTAPSEVTLTAGAQRWRFQASGDLSVTMTDAWYSPSYGVRLPCRAINLSMTADVADLACAFTIGPDAWAGSGAATTALSTFRAHPEPAGSGR